MEQENSILAQLYHSALLSHTNLSNDDVAYAVPKLVEVYQNQLIPILHINMNSYIGKLSEKFNKRLDDHIKTRTLVLDEDYWPINVLNETEKNELLSSLGIISSRFVSWISFARRLWFVLCTKFLQKLYTYI